MAFAEDEKNELRLIFHESMEPIRDLVNKHHQTLYGANEENGLRSEVRSLKNCQSDIETEIVVFKRSVKWIATAVSGAIGTGATILTSFFKQ